MSKAIITEARDLRTGNPLWLATIKTRVPYRQRLPRGPFDTVIVGAGITGATLAYTMRGKGKRVLIVDRRPPLFGSTAASTALLACELDMPLFALSRQIGRSKAERAWQRSVKAVADLHKIIKGERIPCHWRDARTLYLAGDAFGRTALQQEVEARRHAGISSDYLSASELKEQFGVDRTAAILSRGSASADPVLLAAGLLRRAAAAGVQICSPVTIKAIAADRRGATLTTSDDVEIAADHAVFCTGYEILKPVPQQGHKIKSTWALASAAHAEAPAWLSDHLVWEASDPYLYLRQTSDGRIVAGGEDEPYSDAHEDTDRLRRKTDIVAAKVRELIPRTRFTIAHRWAGTFGESATGLPFIDAVPGHPNCYAVMGFGGNGITYAMTAAEIVSRCLAGREDPDADLYKFAEA